MPYYGRSAVERFSCRPFENIFRIAKRYDGLARDYLAAVCIAANVFT